jgi:hypothetical protein
MAISIVLRPIGPTTAVSVTASSTTSVTVSATSNDITVFAAFLNTGTNPVAVQLAQGSLTAPAAVLPVAGTPSTAFLLPASMTQPIVLSVPTPNFSFTAIGTAAGPSLLYVTPVAAQS